MKVDLNWKNFEQSEVPVIVRRDIIKTIGWVRRDVAIDEILEELLAQSMLNIYLQGVNGGLKTARMEFQKGMKGFGHSR